MCKIMDIEQYVQKGMQKGHFVIDDEYLLKIFFQLYKYSECGFTPTCNRRGTKPKIKYTHKQRLDQE